MLSVSRFVGGSLSHPCSVLGRFASCAHSLASATGASQREKGLLVGVYSHAVQPLTAEEPDGTASGEDSKNADKPLILTSASQRIGSIVGNKLVDLLRLAGAKGQPGECRVFYGLFDEFPKVAVVGLGAQNYSYDTPPEPYEDIGRKSENVRIAVGAGVRTLRDLGVTDIEIEDFSDAQSAAEGALMAVHSLDKFKGNAGPKKKPAPTIKLNSAFGSGGSDAQFQRGQILAAAQNLARELMETPSNHMTPRAFADRIVAEMVAGSTLGGATVEVRVREKSWLTEKKMGAFLAIAQGSDEKPVFLELEHRGAPNSKAPPLVLVGKGVTFDTGGISIKPAPSMSMMKGDMGGAATVCSAIRAAAALNLPINIVALVPLCENMPSGKAIKPGDVVTAMNGKTIEIDNTDAEGRLLLADALVHAHSFAPGAIVDVATLTGAMDVALGGVAAGVFCNSTPLWNILKQAGDVAGDPFWRMPLYAAYHRQLKSGVADLMNVGGRSAGACTAAMFLKEFVKCKKWAHIDIAGVMHKTSDSGYLSKGMTGRPTRSLIEFAVQLSSESDWGTKLRARSDV